MMPVMDGHEFRTEQLKKPRRQRSLITASGAESESSAAASSRSAACSTR
jgi:hypothetical protein